MRLFVGLDLPEPTREGLAAALAGATALAGAAAPALRPTPPGRWHVTLCFLGEVAAATLPSLRAALDAVAGAPGPRLRLDGLAAFPRPGAAQVVVARVTGVTGADTAGLARLARSVARASRAGGAPPAGARRRWVPHVTVARSRGGPVDLTAVLGLAVEAPAWAAEEVLLLRSHLGPSPRYEVLGRLPLSGPEGIWQGG